MTLDILPELATDAVVAVEQVGGRVEQVFSDVGVHLGTAHEIFADLNAGMEALSGELSGARIEGAATAFRDIAARLRGLADSLPAETALLANISASAAQASALLKQIIKQIHLVTVIARSSRIEAATLEGNRHDFLSFTREASDLARVVETAVEACSKEQEQVEEAIAMALSGQREFEGQYCAQLMSASKALNATASEIMQLQVRGLRVAAMGKAGTSQIRDAIGMAIVSLQTGDSARQRLEHVCGGLRKLMDSNGAIGRSSGAFVCRLQAAQLRCAVTDFSIGISKVNLALVQLSGDSTTMVERGNSLFGTNNEDMARFLVMMRQRLAEASALISACAEAKAAVESSITQLDEVLGRFRATISALRETVVDITLIGMNAGLKASHLGVKGRAFVEIANELQQAADRISAAEKLLQPVLAEIVRSADRLKLTRVNDKQLDAADLEGVIEAATREIEQGNGRMLQLMDHLTRESERFEGLMKEGIAAMSSLNAKCSALPAVASFLEAPSSNLDGVWPDDALETEELFEHLFSQYTMDAERDAHRDMANEFGIACKPPQAVDPQAAEAEDVLFF